MVTVWFDGGMVVIKISDFRTKIGRTLAGGGENT